MSNQYTAAAAQVLDSATAAGAEYADAQFWTIRSQSMYVRNGVVRRVSDRSSIGYAVRSLIDGSWGFAGSDIFTKTGFDDAAARSARTVSYTHLRAHET